MIDPARLREQRAQVRRPPKPTALGCFTCDRGISVVNWYGLCGKCVHRVPKAKRAEFRERHLQRTKGRAA